ncbi:hypothetical protein J6590_012989 [Homalodisca vitripennis]|nr:hypothetical protein J6590_012989 [Homalodisca vitripennis]
MATTYRDLRVSHHRPTPDTTQELDLSTEAIVSTVAVAILINHSTKNDNTPSDSLTRIDDVNSPDLRVIHTMCHTPFWTVMCNVFADKIGNEHYLFRYLFTGRKSKVDLRDQPTFPRHPTRWRGRTCCLGRIPFMCSLMWDRSSSIVDRTEHFSQTTKGLRYSAAAIRAQPNGALLSVPHSHNTANTYR